MNKQPSFVKLFRLSTYSSAYFSISPFASSPPPLCPNFLEQALSMLSQLHQGLQVAAFVSPSEAERSSSPLVLFHECQPLHQLSSIQPSVIRHGRRDGKGVLLSCGCIQVASGPLPECWPTSLTLFFIGHNASRSNVNSIWMSFVRVNREKIRTKYSKLSMYPKKNRSGTVIICQQELYFTSSFAPKQSVYS